MWNCEGRGVLDLLGDEAYEGVDILILTETWAREQFDIRGFYGYHALASSREGPGRPSGGVSVFVRPLLGEMTVKIVAENLIAVASPKLEIMAE